MTVRILVVDDHELFRAGLVQLIHGMGGTEVVAETAKSEDAIIAATRLQPDIVTLDVEVDGVPVTSNIRRLLRAVPNLRVIVVTMHRDRVLERTVLEAGAVAFVSKVAPSEVLARAILHHSHNHESVTNAQQRSSALLSPREEEVLRLLRQARTNREIAAWLSIAEGTVKRHTGSIYAKLGVSSRMGAVAEADRLGI